MVNIQQNYNIIFTIGEYNFSDSITKIEIGSSIDVGSVYSLFFINFRIDSKLIFVTEFYKNEEIKLQISLTDVDKNIKEICNFDLIGISMKFNIGMKPGLKDNQMLPDHPLGQAVKLIAICKKPFITMTTTVNKLFSYNEKNTPISCVEKLCDSFLKKLENKQINKNNSNNYVIEQMLIPPMTFADSVRFINSKYPLYNGGIPFLFCDKENNLQIWDLTQKIKEREFYRIIYLSKGEKEDKTINITPGENFDCYFTSIPQIKTNLQPNKEVIQTGYENIFINKPLDDLNSYSNIKIDEVYQNHGLKDNDPEETLNFYKSLEYRKSVRYNLTGVSNDILSKSTLNKKISKVVEIKFSIVGNTPIEKLMQIGVPLYLHSNVPEQIKFNGKYIINMSYMVFTRLDSSNYRFGNIITCFRGNF